MADDVTFQTSALATPPSGTVIATDEVSSKHYQRIKVDLGGDGVSSPLIRGQQADADSIPVTLSTELAALITALKTAAEAIETAVEGTLTVTASNLDVQSGGADLATSTQAGAIQTAVELIDDIVKVEDDGHSSGDKGAFVLAVRNANRTTFAGTELDYSGIAVDASGRVIVTGQTAHDATTGDVPVIVGGYASAAAPSDVSADADAVRAWFLRNGAQVVNLSAAGTLIPSGSGNATGALRVELPTNGTGIVGLAAGTNGIGKLTANSGVDIGDVDVTSISAGTNLIGDVGIQPRTTNGLDTFMASGSDGSSILVATAQVIKATAGKLYGYYAYNPEAAVSFVHFYNTAAASVTVGTTNPLFTLAIPAGSAANLQSEIGITFSNAGWSCAATTTAGGNTSPATGVSLVAWYK